MSTVVQFERTVPGVMEKNNIHYIHTSARATSSGLVSSLKSNRNLCSRLFVASQFRDGNVNDYFPHKYQTCPPLLTARGKLKLGTKSDTVRCLEDAPEKQDR